MDQSNSRTNNIMICDDVSTCQSPLLRRCFEESCPNCSGPIERQESTWQIQGPVDLISNKELRVSLLGELQNESKNRSNEAPSKEPAVLPQIQRNNNDCSIQETVIPSTKALLSPTDTYRKRCITLEWDNQTLVAALQTLSAQLQAQEKEFEDRLSEQNEAFSASLQELQLVMSYQQEVGNRWKTEMTELTRKLETKHKDLLRENRKLHQSEQELRARLKAKSNEAAEVREMNGIFSAKVTQLERKIKKLQSQDEESYIEVTF